MYEDTVYCVEHMPDDSIVLTFTKWRVYGDKMLDTMKYRDVHQRLEDNGQAKFLCVDDAELAILESACASESVNLGIPENIELSAQRKQYLVDAQFNRREGMEPIIARGERIQAATTFEELKQEMLMQPMSARSI